jgi:ribosomal protein S18 acetylase RimI-like enzyme
MPDARHTMRVAAVADASGIAQIQASAWQRAYASLMPRDYLEAFTAAKRTAVWQSLLASGTTLVAVIEQRIVGFCSVGPVRDQDLDSARVGEIYALYVEPTLWRRGIGTSLCAAGLGALRETGLARVTLWVLEGNRHGRDFYTKHGFAADGHEKPYRVGEMELRELRYAIGS